jgi:dTDP-4-dehydrorhamnose reductase
LADITRKIFELAKLNNTVTDVTTEKYYKDKQGIAPRPLNSTLKLDKITGTGFTSVDWQDDLKSYIQKELSE